jgi:hypothetical protein
MQEDYLELKEDEKISYDDISDVVYYEDVQIEVNPNGDRWGNDDYYSGDANVKFLDSDGNLIEYIY